MSSDFLRFTSRARKVMTLAQEEAHRLRQADIGSEHLLLGLVREEAGIAGQVLISMGLDLARVRDAVAAGIDQRGAAVSELQLSPRSKQVIERATGEARALHHHYIGTEHLLLGILAERTGPAANALKRLSADPKAIRAEVLRRLSQPAPAFERGDSSSAAGDRRALGEPLRAIPVMESQIDGGARLSLLSLDHFRDGFVLNWHLMRDDGMPLDLATGPEWMPHDVELLLDSHHRFACQYVWRQRIATTFAMHLSLFVTPRLDPSVTAITIRARAAGHNAEGASPRSWEFRLALAPDRD